MSCCRSATIDWRTHDADCKWAPKLSGPTLYGADYPVEHKAQRDAYDRAQQKRNDDVYNIDALVRELALDAIKQRARLDASFGRIEALELEVARLKGPQRMLGEAAAAAHEDKP